MHTSSSLPEVFVHIILFFLWSSIEKMRELIQNFVAISVIFQYLIDSLFGFSEYHQHACNV